MLLLCPYRPIVTQGLRDLLFHYLFYHNLVLMYFIFVVSHVKSARVRQKLFISLHSARAKKAQTPLIRTKHLCIRRTDFMKLKKSKQAKKSEDSKKLAKRGTLYLLFFSFVFCYFWPKPLSFDVLNR